MATVTPVIIQQSANVLEAKWLNLQNGDVGAYLNTLGYQSYTISFYGTNGSGGSTTIEQSPDNGTTAIDLKTTEANVFSTMPITSLPAVQGVLRAVSLGLLRPHVTAGDNTTSISIYLIGTKGN